MFTEILRYSRMAVALQRYLRQPLNTDPEATLRRAMENREANFLGLAASVLHDPQHPYAQLFQVAGCTYGDLENGVRRNGLEKTLEELLRAGVYLSHDEFRGRKEIVRGGRHIPATPKSWLNRRGKGGLAHASGGTSGASMTTMQTSAHMAHMEATTLMCIRELGIAGRAIVNVGAVLPGYGLMATVLANRLRIPVERWYALGGATRQNLHYRMVTRYLVAQMRLFGAKIPYPVYIENNNFRPVAEYLAQKSRDGVPTLLVGYVSAIARVAAEAMDHGLDLRGCLGLVAAEPLTDAKRALIERGGIEPYSTYGMAEFGMVGFPCREMRAGNCVHVLRESVALIPRPQDLDWRSGDAQALCVTSLLPSTPRIFINAEVGDTAVVEPAHCNCGFSRLGMNLQVRTIAAFSKITAQGMTIQADDLVRILEEVLPARFGGRPGDYQLIETEGPRQTESVLRIRPGVTTAAPEAVLEEFLAQTKRLYGGSLSVLLWGESKGIRAEVAPPLLGSTGKLRALRLLGPGTSAGG